MNDLVVAYRFSVADANGKVIGKSVDVYNNSWCVYSGATKYTQLYAVRYQYSKRDWINGTATNFNNNSKISSLSGFNYVASSSIDSTMPQDPSKIGNWLSKNNYANSRILFGKCEVAPQNGYRLIIEPIIQCKLAGNYCAMTPTELAVYGGKAYNYNKVSSVLTPGTFSTLNNYVQMKFPNMLRTSSKQSNLWAAAPKLSSRTSYGNVIDKGYGVAIVNATDVQKEYTVKFVPNGGKYTYNSTLYSATQSFTVKEGTKITLPTASRDYWAFAKWDIIKALFLGLLLC